MKKRPTLEELKKQALKEYMSEIGRKGGETRSEAKLKAQRENIKKATAARLKRKRDRNSERD